MGKHEKKDGVGTLTIMLGIVFITVIVFTVKMILIYEQFQAVPDTLITEFYRAFGGECGFMGAIQIAKTISQGQRKKTGQCPNDATNIDAGNDGI